MTFCGLDSEHPSIFICWLDKTSNGNANTAVGFEKSWRALQPLKLRLLMNATLLKGILTGAACGKQATVAKSRVITIS